MQNLKLGLLFRLRENPCPTKKGRLKILATFCFSELEESSQVKK
jgi:hypothetical protein